MSHKVSLTMLTSVHSLSFKLLLLLSATASGSEDPVPNTSPSQASLDPLLAEFVWFSPFTAQDDLDIKSSSGFLNIHPFMLRGALEPLADHGEDQDKAPEAPKMAIRL